MKYKQNKYKPRLVDKIMSKTKSDFRFLGGTLCILNGIFI